MRFHLVAVGTRVPDWVAEGFADYAKRLQGGARLELHAVAAARRSGASEPDKARTEEAERLRAAGDLFAAKGSLVALENHFLLAPRDLAELVRRADHPGVRVCLDVANSLANGEWPDETIATLAPHTGNLHIKDYEIELDPHGVGMHVVGTAMGEGRLDLGATLDAVPDVDVIVEHWLPKTRFADHAEARRLEFDWTRRGVAKVAALAQAKEQGVKAQGVG